MVNLKIDNKQICVPEGTTIMDAAAQNGIIIPKLCYLKDINEIAACRVCVVEMEGKDRLITSCNNTVQEGMVLYTNSPKVRADRRNTVQLILSQHDCKCATCVRSGNCSLQKIANDLNILDLPFSERLERQPWNKNFPLIRDSAKCIKCMRCIQICDKVQNLHIWDLEVPAPALPSMYPADERSRRQTVRFADNASPTVLLVLCESVTIQKKYGTLSRTKTQSQ